jgi:hypothetical protein
MPFQEQEFCTGIAMGLAVCGVTCNPEAEDSGCPGRWSCGAVFPPCFQDADCGGLTCVGANPEMMVPGRCKCGENGTPSAACPDVYPNFDRVERPRCIEAGQDMFCAAAFNCRPPPLRVNMQTGQSNYPAACMFQ